MKFFKQPLKDKSRNHKGIRCLFAGEILMIISCISFLSFIVVLDWLKFLSLLAIFALIFNLIGIILLKKNSKEFSIAFILTLISIFLTILYIVFSSINKATWTIITSNVIHVVNIFVDIVIMFFVINGIRLLLNPEKDSSIINYGKFSVITYLVCAICVVIITGLLFIPAIDTNNVAKTTLSIVSAILCFVSYAVYLIFLGFSMDKIE